MRILLKLSGEMLSSDSDHLDAEFLRDLASTIHKATNKGTQLAIVLGGGNFWRYRDNVTSGIERTKSDKLGMLATIFNCIGLQPHLDQYVPTNVYSAIHVTGLTKQYEQSAVQTHLESGGIALCAGGSGNPFFTTDSAAALRAAELECDLIIKATNVDGVYDKDPNKNNDAQLFADVTFAEVLDKQLKVMDSTAFALCQDNNIPIKVCNGTKLEVLEQALAGKNVGTLVQ